MIKKLKLLLNKSERLKIFLLLLMILTSSILEMLSIGSIPIFVSFLVEPEILLEVVSRYIKIDFFLNKSFHQQITTYSIILFLIFIVKNIFLFIMNIFQASLFRKLNIENSRKLFKYYISSPFNFHLKTNPALLIRNITGDVPNSMIYLESVINLIKEILLIIVIFSLLIIVDYKISTVVLVIMGLLTISIYYLIKKKIVHLAKINFNFRGAQNKIVNHVFGAIKDIKILQKETYFIDEFNYLAKGIQKITFFSAITSKFPRLLFEIIAIATMLIFVLLFLYNGKGVQEVLPILSLVAVATVRLIPSFNQILLNFNTLRKTEISFNSVTSEITDFRKNFLKLKDKTDINFENNKINEIEIKNLSFKYPDTEKYILRDINLKIKGNSSIGIIGQTGCGKTTLLNLIVGLLNPTSGDILVNGKSIFKNIDQWLFQSGYISQNIFLLDESIKKNIALGINEERIDYDKIKDSIKLAGIEKFINNLPNGINTFVGAQGIRLSGGQIQRIGIARALYKKSKVLYFDEATSSLDQKTENQFISDVEVLKKDKTLIMISHKLSALRICDNIYMFSDGKIKDQGKLEELLKRNPELKN